MIFYVPNMSFPYAKFDRNETKWHKTQTLLTPVVDKTEADSTAGRSVLAPTYSPRTIYIASINRTHEYAKQYRST